MPNQTLTKSSRIALLQLHLGKLKMKAIKIFRELILQRGCKRGNQFINGQDITDNKKSFTMTKYIFTNGNSQNILVSTVLFQW